MQPAICVDRLAVTYASRGLRKVEAVKDLSFSVEPGEVVGFLGPNGAGKSSTLKALMGFVQPFSGQCQIFGEMAGSYEAKRQTGYLPEVAMYYPFLTPLETLRLYGELQGLCGKALTEESHELLELVGLSNAKTKRNKSLSKGMLQRVGIAQSLLGNPKLLVLDEVTSGLDPIGRQELRNLLKQRQEQGTTLFFSSHELSEVEMLCDRILVIHEGRMVEERDVKALKEELTRYEITYSGNCSLIDLASDLEAISPSINSAKFSEKSSLLKAVARINESGGEVSDIIAQEGSLEEYFVETIRRAA